MNELSRDELNEAAAAAGVPEPDSLPNKQAVIEAIEAVNAPAKPRVFKLRDPIEGAEDEDVVNRVSVGDSPRVSIGTGETFATVDEKLAERLANDEHLEEVVEL